MNAQLAINFASTAPYARHSATSKAAAKAVEPRMGTQKATVLIIIRRCSQPSHGGGVGLTDEQICMFTELSGDTVRPRRGALADAGLIKKQGTRKTTSGRDADVWVAV